MWTYSCTCNIQHIIHSPHEPCRPCALLFTSSLKDVRPSHPSHQDKAMSFCDYCFFGLSVSFFGRFGWLRIDEHTRERKTLHFMAPVHVYVPFDPWREQRWRKSHSLCVGFFSAFPSLQWTAKALPWLWGPCHRTTHAHGDVSISVLSTCQQLLIW